MKNTQPYNPIEIDRNLKSDLERFLVENEFPTLYQSYSWGKDWGGPHS